MGEFTEVVLGFTFRSDVPEHVLAAFSALVVPPGPDDCGTPGPALPAPFAADEDDWWEPSDEEVDPRLDPTPWAHDWAAWFRRSMSVMTVPTAQLAWSLTGRWVVSCRWSIKSPPESVLPALEWLGPYLEGFERRPILLGHLSYDADPRPVLVWLTPAGRIEGENLNGSGSRH